MELFRCFQYWVVDILFFLSENLLSGKIKRGWKKHISDTINGHKRTMQSYLLRNIDNGLELKFIPKTYFLNTPSEKYNNYKYITHKTIGTWKCNNYKN